MAAHDHTHDGRQTIDLGDLALSSGEGRRINLEVEPGRLALGGLEYSLGGGVVKARLDISKTATGYALRLRFKGELAGECMRCLGPADAAVGVDAIEVDQPGASDEEMRSPYVDEGVLDIGAWAHDALALALPAQVLCRPECAGLCAVCGQSLNDAEPGAHDHPREPDPRWAKLLELQE